MWKYVSRRIRDTFERSANHFVERRSATGVTNSTNNNNEDNKSNSPCKWYYSRKCWNSYHSSDNTNSKRCSFEYVNRNWIGAITWSSALVLGWYTSQLIHLKHKYASRKKSNKSHCINILSSLYPFFKHADKNIKSVTKIERLIEDFTPTVHFISNENNGRKQSVSSDSGNDTKPDKSDSALGDVLNSIENRLGLAAIEHGQHKEGLSMLRSAANRNHAPALYNLGLCYEMGLGVKVDEKSAMELYRAAAVLDHPGALYNLGVYYGQGRGGLKRNTEIAIRLLRLAAVQGQKDAVDALETLNDTEAQTEEFNSWSNQTEHSVPYVHSDSVIPSQTTLFVENVHLIPKNEDVVY